MACRRGLLIRNTLFSRKFNSPLTYLSHEHDRSNQEDLHSSKSTIERYIDQRRSLRIFVDTNNSGRFSGAFHRTSPVFAGSGLCLNRFMSTSISLDNEVNNDADVVTEVPGVSEVAIAAADSAFPVAALEYLIAGVHSYTRLEWWACIAISTLIIRGATLPFTISLLKSSTKLKLLMPHLKEIMAQTKETGMEPQAVAEGQKKITQLFKEYGVTPFSSLKALLIQAPVIMSFYLAINNMTKKVPSFKDGGALWFTDLTVPDSMYIFPVLTALTVMATMELKIQTTPGAHPVTGTFKKVSRGLPFLTIPFTMNFPQSMLCYWFTSNLFTLCYESVLKISGVKKALGVPDITVMPSCTTQKNAQSGLSICEDPKQASYMNNEAPVEKCKLLYKKTPSSTAALSQRLINLEKKVKQKKRMKKLK